MSSLKRSAMEVIFWVTMTAINGWAIGRFLHQDDTAGVIISIILGAVAAIIATMEAVDFYYEWQDERYERAFLASAENFPAVEDE